MKSGRVFFQRESEQCRNCIALEETLQTKLNELRSKDEAIAELLQHGQKMAKQLSKQVMKLEKHNEPHTHNIPYNTHHNIPYNTHYHTAQLTIPHNISYHIHNIPYNTHHTLPYHTIPHIIH